MHTAPGLASELLGTVGEVHVGVDGCRLTAEARQFIPEQDERPAVILVVVSELLLQAGIVRVFPEVSPDEALESRRVHLVPTRTDEGADILQAIRPDREVDPTEDFLVKVDHPPEVCLDIRAVSLAHSSDGPRLVTPIVDDGRIGVRIENGTNITPDPLLVLLRVGPERACQTLVTTADQNPDQIVELLIGDTLDVEEDLHRLPDDAGWCLEVNLPGPDRQGLELQLERRAGDDCSLAPPRPEEIGQLVDGENALLV